MLTTKPNTIQIDSDGRTIFAETSEGAGLILAIPPPELSLTRINHAYYAKDLQSALHIHRRLVCNQRKILEQEVCEDSALLSQWQDMSRAGFFYEPEISRGIKIAFRLQQTPTFASQVAQSLSFAFNTGTSFCFHLYEDEIEKLPKSVHLIQSLARKWQEEQGSETAVAILRNLKLTAISRLQGEVTDWEPLIEALDREQLRLIWRSNASFDRLQQWEHLSPAVNRLESEGFQFPFWFDVNAEELSKRPDLTRFGFFLENLLNECPTRQIHLEIEKPALNAAANTWEIYFSGLRKLLDALFVLQADISRLSIFGVYVENILSARYAPFMYEGEWQENELDLFPQGNFDSTWSWRCDSALLKEFRAVCEAKAVEEASAHSRYCQYWPVCPDSISIPSLFFGHRNDQSDLIRTGYCAIHNRIIPGIFEELLAHCEQNLPDAKALRLDLTEQKQSQFSALYESGGFK